MDLITRFDVTVATAGEQTTAFLSTDGLPLMAPGACTSCLGCTCCSSCCCGATASPN
jgi:hypothetical protein